MDESKDVLVSQTFSNNVIPLSIESADFKQSLDNKNSTATVVKYENQSTSSSSEDLEMGGRQRPTTNGNHKIFKCNLCNFGTTLKKLLREHLQRHTLNKLTCSKCDYSAMSPTMLLRHYVKHIVQDKPKNHASQTKKSLQCPDCGFVATRSLKRHRIVHSRTTNMVFKCTECNYSSLSEQSYRRHQKNIHNSHVLLHCSECAYTTTVSIYMNRHRKIHTTEKRHKCDECTHSARTSRDLRIHKRIHTQEKPYKCVECGYSTKQYGHLQGHMRIHTGEKPYKCSECNYATAYGNSLKNHMGTIHGIGNPIKCPDCDFVCLVRKKLWKHRKKHDAHVNIERVYVKEEKTDSN